MQWKTIRVDEQTLKRLKAIAARQGLSMTELVRQFAEQHADYGGTPADSEIPSADVATVMEWAAEKAQETKEQWLPEIYKDLVRAYEWWKKRPEVLRAAAERLRQDERLWRRAEMVELEAVEVEEAVKEWKSVWDYCEWHARWLEEVLQAKAAAERFRKVVRKVRQAMEGWQEALGRGGEDDVKD